MGLRIVLSKKRKRKKRTEKKRGKEGRMNGKEDGEGEVLGEVIGRTRGWDWKYKNEGAINLVVSYIGDEPVLVCFVFLFVCLFVCLFIYLFVYLFICLFVYLFICCFFFSHSSTKRKIVFFDSKNNPHLLLPLPSLLPFSRTLSLPSPSSQQKVMS